MTIWKEYIYAAKCITRPGCVDPLTAEATAAVYALRFCKDMGLHNICLEGDAKLVVDAVNSGEANWSRIGHLMEDLKMLLCTFTQWEVRHVRRQANFAAHSLAKMAAHSGLDWTWLKEISNCISDIIRIEQSSLSF